MNIDDIRAAAQARRADQLASSSQQQEVTDVAVLTWYRNVAQQFRTFVAELPRSAADQAQVLVEYVAPLDPGFDSGRHDRVGWPIGGCHRLRPTGYIDSSSYWEPHLVCVTLAGRILLEYPSRSLCNRSAHPADCVLDSVGHRAIEPPADLADLRLPRVHRLPTKSHTTGLLRQRTLYDTVLPPPPPAFPAPPTSVGSAAEDQYRASLYAGLAYSMPLFAARYGIHLSPIAPVVHPWMKFKKGL